MRAVLWNFETSSEYVNLDQHTGLEYKTKSRNFGLFDMAFANNHESASKSDKLSLKSEC